MPKIFIVILIVVSCLSKQWIELVFSKTVLCLILIAVVYIIEEQCGFQLPVSWKAYVCDYKENCKYVIATIKRKKEEGRDSNYKTHGICSLYMHKRKEKAHY